MSKKPRTILFAAVVFLLLVLIVCVFWFGRSTVPASPQTVLDSNFAVEEAEAPNEPEHPPLAEEVIENVPIAGDVPMPTDDRNRFVEQLLDKGLPIQPNLRKVAKQHIKDKALKELIEGLGEPWTSSTPCIGVARDDTSILWLTYSFESNLRVKKIILEARKNPELVGPVICEDLLKRARNWPDTAEAYLGKHHKKGGDGYVVSQDGKTMGNQAFAKYCQDQYAIPADLFILSNIDYEKGLEALVDFAYWKYTVGMKFEMTADGPLGHYQVDPKGRHAGRPARSQLNDDMLFYAVAMYLENNTDPKYQETRDALQKILDGRDAFKKVTTDAPDALWPHHHPVLASAGVDTAAEPKMTLWLANLDIVEARQLWNSRMMSVFIPLVQARQSSTPQDPNNQRYFLYEMNF